MLSVCIWGMPQLPEDDLVELTNAIITLLSSPLIMEGRVKRDKRTCVFFQKDQMEWELGAEVLIEIKGYKHYPHFQTGEIFQRLTAIVKSAIKIQSGEAYVECHVPSVYADNDLVVSS